MMERSKKNKAKITFDSDNNLFLEFKNTHTQNNSIEHFYRKFIEELNE